MNVTPTGDSWHTQNIQIKHWKAFATAWLCWSAVKVTESCLTFCDPRYYSLPGSSVHGDSLGKNTGLGCHSLLLGKLPNPGIEPRSPARTIGGFFTIWATREVHIGYVNHFNVWVAHKLREKKLLTIFPHVILYLKVMKIKTNCDRWWKVDTAQ